MQESNLRSAPVAGHHDYKSCDASSYINLAKVGTRGGTRTLTSLRTTDFKSVASAIPPLERFDVCILHLEAGQVNRNCSEPTGLEPATSAVTGQRSNQLS